MLLAEKLTSSSTTKVLDMTRLGAEAPLSPSGLSPPWIDSVCAPLSRVDLSVIGLLREKLPLEWPGPVPVNRRLIQYFESKSWENIILTQACGSAKLAVFGEM